MSTSLIDLLAKSSTPDEPSLLEIKYEDNHTPLHLSCKLGFYSAIEKLIECNADFLAKDKSGNTALHLAACLKSDRSISAMKTAIENQTGGKMKWQELLLIKNSNAMIPVMLSDNQNVIAVSKLLLPIFINPYTLFIELSLFSH